MRLNLISERRMSSATIKVSLELKFTGQWLTQKDSRALKRFRVSRSSGL